MPTAYIEDVSRVTSVFGEPRSNGPHRGVDVKQGISGSQPDAKVYATVEAEIEYVSEGYNYGRGKNVIMKFTDGNNIMRLRAQHLKSISCKKGDKVNPGTLIGIEGATGDCVGQYPEHTHFELVRNGSLYKDGEIKGGTVLDPCYLLSIENKKGVYPVVGATLEGGEYVKLRVYRKEKDIEPRSSLLKENVIYRKEDGRLHGYNSIVAREVTDETLSPVYEDMRDNVMQDGDIMVLSND